MDEEAAGNEMTLVELATQIAEATEDLTKAIQVRLAAQRDEATCADHLDELQEKFDELVVDAKRNAPSGSFWSSNR